MILKNLIQQKQILEEWSRLYERPVSSENYEEVCHNLSGFFMTLKQWSDDEKRTLKENGQNNDQ